MKLPTSDEIAKAKADALVRFGRAEVLLVQLPKPINFALLVAPMNLERHNKLVDAQAHDVTTSHGPVVLDALLWPAAEEWLAVAKVRPAAPKKVVHQILKRAGREDDAAKVELLAELVAALPPPAHAEQVVIPELTAAMARKLLEAEDAKEEPRELWAVFGPGLSCVMAAPEPDVYLASQVALQNAQEKKEGITEARLGFTRDAIVWTSRPIDVVLDDKPAIHSDLTHAWLTMGGEVADATSRSF
jgi:hypothetical protein